MKLEEILTNLDRTIKNKTEFMESLDPKGAQAFIIEVLVINLLELNNIRDDIIKVMESSR